jgi:hypothetical protein
MQYLVEDNAKIGKIVDEAIQILISRGYPEERIKNNDLVLAGIVTGIIRGFLVADFENTKTRRTQ